MCGFKGACCAGFVIAVVWIGVELVMAFIGNPFEKSSRKSGGSVKEEVCTLCKKSGPGEKSEIGWICNSCLAEIE